MRQDVIARQVRAMKDAGLDAIVSISPENFAYVTGFLSPTAPIMRWRHAMALVTADGKVALVVVDMEANTIRAKSPAGTEIAVWSEFKFDAMQVLADRHAQARARRGRASASSWTICRPAISRSFNNSFRMQNS